MTTTNNVLGTPERVLYGILAFVIFIGGCVALGINSYILYSGVWQATHSESARYALGFFAGMVPWFIAVMPLLIENTWRRWGVIRIPSIGTAAIIVVWTAFIGYNLVNGAGAIANERTAVVSSKEHANSTFSADKERRLALLEEAKGIPQARPTATVGALIAGEKVKRLYELSDQCADPKSKTQRTFCVNLQSLEAEQSSAARRAEIGTEVEKLNTKLAETGDTVGGATDPQADMIYALSCTIGCWDKASIALWLPASTPIVLEMTAATSWYFAGIAFGIAIGRRGAPRKAMPHTSSHNASAPSVPLLATSERLDRQYWTERDIKDRRAVADSFFKSACVPAVGASLAEREWFEHYEHYCRLINADVLPLELFRRVAGKYVESFGQVEGEYHYHGVLPVMEPALRKAAAE